MAEEQDRDPEELTENERAQRDAVWAERYAESRERYAKSVGLQEVTFSLRCVGAFAPSLFDQQAAIDASNEGRGDFFELYNAAGRAYKVALEAELAGATGFAGWEMPWDDLAPGDSFGDPFSGDAVYLLAEVTKIGETILTWVGMAAVLRAGIKRLREIGEAEPVVDEGAAAVLASEAIFHDSKERELDFAFSTPISARGAKGRFIVTEPDAFLVGFRGDDALWTAVVLTNGDVLGVATQPLPSDLPAWWRRFEADMEREWGE